MVFGTCLNVCHMAGTRVHCISLRTDSHRFLRLRAHSPRLRAHILACGRTSAIRPLEGREHAAHASTLPGHVGQVGSLLSGFGGVVALSGHVLEVGVFRQLSEGCRCIGVYGHVSEGSWRWVCF